MMIMSCLIAHKHKELKFSIKFSEQLILFALLLHLSESILYQFKLNKNLGFFNKYILYLCIINSNDHIRILIGKTDAFKM